MPARHPDRRVAGHRADPHHRDAAADHLRSRPAAVADHAGRHLLRRAVWRLDHVDPGQYSRRGGVDRHLHRRPSDGQAGPRRRGACGRRIRLVLRRLRRHRFHRGLRPAARRDRAGVQLARLLLADGARPRHRGDPGARLGHQGRRHGAGRPPARSRRHRREQRPHALHVRRLGIVGRHRFRPAGDRTVRRRRDHPQSRAAIAAALAIQRQDQRPVAEPQGLRRFLARGSARHRLGVATRHSAGRRRGACLVCELHAGEEGRQGPEPVRQGRDRGRGRAGVRPTTRPRRPRSFRCSRSACRPTPSWP